MIYSPNLDALFICSGTDNLILKLTSFIYGTSWPAGSWAKFYQDTTSINSLVSIEGTLIAAGMESSILILNSAEATLPASYLVKI